MPDRQIRFFGIRRKMSGFLLPKQEENDIISRKDEAHPIFYQEEQTMKYVCNVCGWVYDEEETGVKWEDLPEDFACELCGVGKEDFSPEE